MTTLMSFGAILHGTGSHAVIVRTFIKYGVDLIKLNLSGESMTTPMPRNRRCQRKRTSLP